MSASRILLDHRIRLAGGRHKEAPWPRIFLIVAALALTIAGCAKKDGPIVLVAASYPGADSQTVATVIAAPIEQQINGVEGLIWLESESGDDGGYRATLRFRSGIDPQLAGVLVKNRVELALPILPMEVQKTGTSVQIGRAAEDSKLAAICLIDSEDQGPEAMQRWSAAVKKRLAAKGAAVNPEVFPGPGERRIVTRIDRSKCDRLGVTEAGVRQAVRAAGPAASIDALKLLTIDSASGQKIPLDSVTALEETIVPPAVYRVNLRAAVRITGLPPEGQSPAQAAAWWVRLAEAEIPKSFKVENLTAK